MFGSTILEIAIGIIFVYLLLSLIATAANELISSVLKWRARTLTKGINNLLHDPALANRFYEHPLVRALSNQGKKPSYIPSRTFALALLDLVAQHRTGKVLKLDDIKTSIENSNAPQPLKDALLVFIHSAANDLRQAVSDFAKVQENIEIWFNNSMDRVAGWYKRKTQALLFVLSALFTGFLNVDTIMIVRTLSADSVLRTALVEQAKKVAEQPPAGVQAAPPPAPGAAPAAEPDATDKEIIEKTKEAKQELVKRIRDLQTTGVPMGWNAEKVPHPCVDPWWWLLKILGLAVTVMAASLGAPFWFDILNKFITIRSTGKAPEEGPKSPKEVPLPLEPGQLPSHAIAAANPPGVAAAPATPNPTTTGFPTTQ